MVKKIIWFMRRFSWGKCREDGLFWTKGKKQSWLIKKKKKQQNRKKIVQTLPIETKTAQLQLD